LFGAVLLAYHCYLLRLGKTTKEHWTEARQSKVDLLDTSTVLESNLATALAAPHAKAATQKHVEQAKEANHGLVERKGSANPPLGNCESKPVPTNTRTVMPKRTPLRARRPNRDLDSCSTLCGNVGPRLLDPYDRVSKQVVTASLEAARSAREKYIRHRAAFLQEKYRYPRELAVRRSIRDMDGADCPLCAGTCVEQACKEVCTSISRRWTLHVGFCWRALFRCDARGLFRKEKAMEV